MRTSALIAASAVLVVAGCSSSPTASPAGSAAATVGSPSVTPAESPSRSTTPATPAPSDPLTGFYDVGGRRLWLECTGSGTPTIVIDVGNDDTIHGSWGAVFAPMSKISHVCAYDRANLGKSDPAPARTIQDVAEDLATLLTATKVPGPYVFVGGSFGGNVVGNLAAEHPDLVAGTVFVDSEPANLDPGLDPVRSNITKAQFTACCSQHYGPPPVDSPDNGEHIDYVKGAAIDVANVGKQPHVPTVVLTADQYDCLADWPCDKIIKSEETLQAEWIAGNPKGTQTIVHSGHVMQRENPQAILDATKSVIDAVRS